MLTDAPDLQTTTDLRSVPAAAPIVYRSEDLLKNQKEILIQHGAEVYRLRLTRSGKLILQK